MRLILVFLLIATSTPAFAQSRIDAARSALAKIQVDSRLRVRVNGAAPIEGALTGASRDSLLIREDSTSQRRLAIADIDSLWTRRSSSANYAFVGGLVTGIPTAVMAVGFASWDTGRTSPSLGAFFAGLAVGAIPGALLGARVARGNRWTLVFP